MKNYKTENKNCSKEILFLLNYVKKIEEKKELLKKRIIECEEEIRNIREEKKLLQEKKNMNVDYFSPSESKHRKREEELFGKEACLQSDIKSYQDMVEEEEREKNLFTDILNKLKLLDHKDSNNGGKQFLSDQEDKNQRDEDKIRFGRNILETQEIERNRIARELHDSIVQNLTNFSHKTELCMKLVDIDTVRIKLELQEMKNSIHITIDDIRDIIYDLRPMSLDDLGLSITVERYILKLQNNNEKIKFVLNSNEEDINTPAIIKLTLFRIIQEACNNAIKYAKASMISISLEYKKEIIVLYVKDNGIGFDIAQVNNKSLKSGFGLSIMRERVNLLSGNIYIDSIKNQGTSIKVIVPYLTH